MSKKLRILLIAGHGAGDPGACGHGVEADEARKVLNAMKSMFVGYDVTVETYPVGRNAYADIGNGTLQVDFANYDYVFEIHFNSFADKSANGFEVWVTPAESGIGVEQLLCSKMTDIGFANRGVKREDFRVIRTAKNRGTSAALVEVCFISNSTDMTRYSVNFNNVCEALVTGIVEGFNVGGSGNVAPPVTNPTPPPSNNAHTVEIVNNAIYVLDGPSPDNGVVQTIYKGEVYTIVSVQNGYGKLKSGAGWINLKYTKTVGGSTPQASNKVEIVNNAIYVLDGPSPDNGVVQTIYKGEVYTIVETKNGYGKLKSGAGWINLKYTKSV